MKLPRFDKKLIRALVILAVLFLVFAPIDPPNDDGAPVTAVILHGDYEDNHGSATMSLRVRLEAENREVEVPLPLGEPYLPGKRISIQRQIALITRVESWRFENYLPNQGVEDVFSVPRDL